MLKGVALAFLTYALFSWTDAIVKGLGPELPVAEIVFFATLAQAAVILILRPRGERWRDMFRMHHPKRVLLRMVCGIVAGLLGTYAFTTIPLAALPLPNPQQFHFRYTLLELNTAAKPWMFEYVF